LLGAVLDGGWRCSTVPTGLENDPDAVIDQKFKARYADNLYVVDASVFPIIPSAVPNPTVTMPANALRLG
jgi:choline dehydrogenase